MSTPTINYWPATREKLSRLKGTQLRLRKGWSGFPETDFAHDPLCRRARGNLGAWMTRAFCVAAVLAVILAASASKSADYSGAFCDPTEPDSCIYPISEGEPAPYSGQLITNRRAARLVLSMETCGALVGLETDRTRDEWSVKYGMLEDQCRVDQEAATKQFDAMQKRLEAATAPKQWWQQPVMAAALSAAATMTVALTVALAAR